MSEVVRSVWLPEEYFVEIGALSNGDINLSPYSEGVYKFSIRLNPKELTAALWREVFKANPEITPELAEAMGVPMENLVMLAHCAGLDVEDKGHKWGGSALYRSTSLLIAFIGDFYKKITVSMPESETGPLTKAHLKISTAQLEKIDALTRENEALKAALATVEAAVGDVLGRQEGATP